MSEEKKNETRENENKTSEETLRELLAAVERIDKSLAEIAKASEQPQHIVTYQPYYSVKDVCKLLGIGRNLVNELADRKNDPLLFTRISFQDRGKFIAHNDLVNWVRDNAITLDEWRRLKGGGSQDDD